MKSRRAYQLALIACVALGVFSAVVAILGWLTWAVAALAVSVVTYAGAQHLRTLVILQRRGTAAAVLDPAALTALQAAADSMHQTVGDVQRAQAASESFILADLLALRQRLNTLIDLTEDARQEEAR